MAVVIAEGEVVVTADASAVPKKIADEVSKGDAALNKAGQKSGGSLFGGILKTGALAVAGVGVLLAGKAITGGISRALGIEDAQAKLTGLGHSTQAVDGIMQNALASVRGTAFGLNDAATVAASAVAAGIAPGKALEANLKLVADAATIAGTDMGSMGAVFNKVAASNKLQGDTIAQLHDMGIPALSLVAKQLGVTAEEAAAMASRGEVDFATFSAAMEAGMGGAALKSGETFRGALANAGAALNRLGEMFAAPALQALTPLLVSVTGVVDRLATALRPVADLFAAQLIPLVDTLAASFDGLNFDGVIDGANTMTSVGSVIGSVVASVISGLAALLPQLITMLPTLITTVVAAIPELAMGLIAMLPQLLEAGITLFTSLIDAVVTILPMLLTTIVGMLPQLVTSILSMIPQILDAALNLFVKLVEAIPVILPQLLNAIINLAPKLVSSVISMIPQLLNSAIKLFTGIVEAIPKIVPKLVPALLDLAPKMVSTIIGLIPQLLQAGVDLIGGLVSGLWKAAGSVGSALLSIAQDAIGGFLSFLGIHSPSRLMEGYGLNTIQGLVNGMDERPVVAQMNKVASAMSRTLSTSLDAGVTTASAGSATMQSGAHVALTDAGVASAVSSSASGDSGIIIYGDVVLDAKNVREFNDVVEMIRALPQVARAGRGEMKGA